MMPINTTRRFNTTRQCRSRTACQARNRLQPRPTDDSAVSSSQRRRPIPGLLHRAVGPGLLRLPSRLALPRLAATDSASRCSERPSQHPSYPVIRTLIAQSQGPYEPQGQRPRCPTEVVIAMGTAPEREASELARTLVAERLVGRVSLLARARSIHRWQGRICDELETVLVMKTTRGRLDKLARRYVALHSDEVPDLLVLPVLAGHPAYLEWVGRATTTTD